MPFRLASIRQHHLLGWNNPPYLRVLPDTRTMTGRKMQAQQMDRLIEVDGISLHIVECGPADGEPVLLLHGFPEFWWGWHNQIPALAEAGFRVVAVDMRGYGQSSAPADVGSYALGTLVSDIAQLTHALGWERFNLIGHDWGGVVGWTFASYHPLRLKRLMILNAPHPDVLPSVIRTRPSQLLRSSYIGFFQLPVLPETVLSAGNYALLRRALTSTSRSGTFSKEDLQRYTAEWERERRLKAMLHYYRALMRKPRVRVGRIAPPTLLLWGCKDQALDQELAKASLLQCVNGRMISHRTATHWLHHEEPDWVNEHLIRFLSEDHELDRPEPGASAVSG
jgi:pimeloyl-ACP methyl ester carboxylesterase